MSMNNSSKNRYVRDAVALCWTSDYLDWKLPRHGATKCLPCGYSDGNFVRLAVSGFLANKAWGVVAA